MSVNMLLPQPTASAFRSGQSKYYKIWEGNLDGVRQGQPVFITRLEGYRNDSASEMLAANWPPTLQIARLISQDHMNDKRCVGKADLLEFRALKEHGFLGQLQEKKLCCVIQLPSQTLLLAVEKECRLIGMLFPREMLVFKPQISSQQQLSQVPRESQDNISGAQTIPSGMSINQYMVNTPGPAGVSSGNSTLIPTPVMSLQVSSPVQSFAVNNNSEVNMSLSQQAASALQSAQTKYYKVWEGNLDGVRQGQPVFITRLEGYRNDSASERLAANWPPTMQIVRLISQDHMNNKQYVGRPDFLVFQALHQHGFLGQLQEKKLCGVIQLTSQTLLLAASVKKSRLIGMLFPGDMLVFKPQISNQQQLSQVQQESYGNISGAQTVTSGMSINQNMVNGPGPAGVSSGNTTIIPTPDMSPQVSSPVQPFAVNNNSAVNMLLSQQTASTLQSAQTKYFKAWEGNLFGLRKGQPVFITGLEGYRKDSASEMVAANWPPTMHIVRLISQDHMNNKQCVGKADFLVFRAFCQHGFLGQLQEKKLCAVIQLPSRTLLLAVSEKACRLMGMLLPGDMVVFKSQTSATIAKKRNLSS